MFKLVYICAHFTCYQGFAQNPSSSMWTKNFQMYKVGFEEAQKPEVKLLTFIWSWRMQGNSRKMSTSASLTTLNPLTVWIPTNWKILKGTGVPDCLTYLLRNLYVGQGATVIMDMEQQTGSKSGKEYIKAVYCHPTYLTYMQSTSLKMLDWMNRKLELRLPEETSITLDLQITPHLIQKVKRN